MFLLQLPLSEHNSNYIKPNSDLKRGLRKLLKFSLGIDTRVQIINPSKKFFKKKESICKQHSSLSGLSELQTNCSLNQILNRAITPCKQAIFIKMITQLLHLEFNSKCR